MNSSYIVLIIMFLVIFLLYRKRSIAAVVAHKKKKNKTSEGFEMKELAQKFIGKDCIIYTVASNYESIKGVITEITDNGILIDDNGNLQAVNLEYVTRIREWPRNSKGKKKTVFE